MDIPKSLSDALGLPPSLSAEDLAFNEALTQWRSSGIDDLRVLNAYAEFLANHPDARARLGLTYSPRFSGLLKALPHFLAALQSIFSRPHLHGESSGMRRGFRKSRALPKEKSAIPCGRSR